MRGKEEGVHGGIKEGQVFVTDTLSDEHDAVANTLVVVLVLVCIRGMLGIGGSRGGE